MRKRRQPWIWLVIVLGIVGVVLVSVVIPWQRQNAEVRAYFDGYFTTIQRKDAQRLRDYYYVEQDLHEPYLRQLFKYELLGWKITRVTGQPFPKEVLRRETNEIYVDAYYRLPAALLRPTGLYRKITHPRYGACGVVPVKLQFAFWPDFHHGWFIHTPDYMRGTYWACPYEGSVLDK